MNNVYKFEIEVQGDVISGETFPIYDDTLEKLLGGFTLLYGETIFGFISGVNHPAAIFISSESPFYFTPRDDKNGKVSYGVISEVSCSPLSVKILKAKEEL